MCRGVDAKRKPLGDFMVSIRGWGVKVGIFWIHWEGKVKRAGGGEGGGRGRKGGEGETEIHTRRRSEYPG